MRVGDWAHVFILLNTTSFVVTVLLHVFSQLDVFSSAFQAEGFCIVNSDKSTSIAGISVPLSSHALCFFSDTIFALLLFLLSRSCKDEAAMKPVFSSCAAIFGHGLAHLGLHSLGNAFAGTGSPIVSPISPSSLVRSLVGLFAFYFCIFQSSDAISPRTAAAHSLLHSTVTTLLVPPRFGFTYVQTALMLVYSFAELRRPAADKNRFWDLHAVVVGVPVGFVGWLEALTCESGYGAAGGHVLYDTSISLTILAYGLIVRSQAFSAPMKSKGA